MTDIATNLNTIDGSLSDIKTAIVNKGVTPSGNITTFATAIDNIPSGGGSSGKYALLDRVKDDNNNEIGTVSGFFTDANNVEYAVVCLDAQYRLAEGTWCSDASTVTNLPIYDSATWGPWEATETATFNTQKILDYCTANSYTSSACSHCRSQSFTIDSTTYYGQLPNMIEVNDIVRNHTALNTADITASSYSSVNFSRSRNVWSSSQLGSATAGIASTNGYMNYLNKTNGRVVAPVLEISNV